MARSSSAASSSAIRVSTFSWPMPRRGSLFSMSTSSRDRVLRRRAIDTRRHALRDRHHPPADDQHPVVVAGDVRLDHDVPAAALGARDANARRTSSSDAQVEPDAAAVVAVERLDHDRDSRSCVRPRDRRRPRRGTVSERGTGSPAAPSSWLVSALSDAMSTAMRRRARGHRRADALLVDALAELHQAVAVEPDPRDVARDRLVDDRLRRGPERRALRDADEALERRPAKSIAALGSSGATRWLTSATAMRPASSPTCSSRYS